MSDQIGLKLTKEMSDSRKGDFAEFYAVTWLWDQGFEVFKNCGCDGMVDLIAWDKPNNAFTLIDVKTAHYYAKLQRYQIKNIRSKEQIEKNVQLLQFFPHSRKLRFTEHKK